MQSRRSIMIEYSILEAVHDMYEKVKNNNQLKNEVSNKPLEWLIYHDNPFYLTDGQTCIMFQAILPSSPQNLNKLSPYNNTRTNYYNTFKGCYKVFDCTESVLQKTDTNDPYPLPYSPFFHFKQRFQQFKEERVKKQKQTTECRIIQIESWKLNIVHVANTGFVAPIISVLSFTKKSSVRIKNAGITSILYDSQTQRRMLSYYNQLLREEKHPQSNIQNNLNTNFQLCPFIKVNKNPSNFLNIDFKNTVLSGPKERVPGNERLIIFSNSVPSEGHYYLKQPLGHKVKALPRIPIYSQQARNKVNEDLFADLADRSASESDDDDPLRDYHQPDNENPHNIKEDEEQDDEEESDNILRRLYQKMLQKDNMQKIAAENRMEIEKQPIAEPSNEVVRSKREQIQEQQG